MVKWQVSKKPSSKSKNTHKMGKNELEISKNYSQNKPTNKVERNKPYWTNVLLVKSFWKFSRN
jgi:hypothetical protein